MLEHLVNALLAREQVTLLLGGIAMVLLGALFIADQLYSRRRARRVPGVVVGVREQPARGRSGSRVYFPVVEYVNERGERVTAETDAGSSNLADKMPGRRVTLLVQSDRPLECRIPGIGRTVFGVTFLLLGTVTGAIALYQYRINAWTFIVGTLLVLALMFAGLRRLAAGTPSATAARASARRYRQRVEQRQALALLTAEALRPRLRRMQTRAARLAPLAGLAALALIGSGHWLAADLYELLSFGRPATGRIVGYESVFRPTDRIFVHYPEVVFTTREGQRVRFRDRAGSGAATTARSSGARVTVIYHPNDPGHAMIYQGLWSWAAPLGLIVAGLGILGLSVRTGLGRVLRAGDC